MHRIIVAKHFTGIFVQKSINLGLQTVICPDIEADKGDELEPFTNKLVTKPAV